MKVLVIDNYDSFTYNLVYMIRQHKQVKKLEVLRNDHLTSEQALSYDKILLSPGPGIPSEAGNMPGIIQDIAAERSILGICLGHQGIGEAFGCELENMQDVLHGFQDEIDIDTSDYLFKGLPTKIACGHYHSWRIRKATMSGAIEIISTDADGQVMAIRHKEYDLRGLQFHPESVMTPQGSQIISNWLNN